MTGWLQAPRRLIADNPLLVAQAMASASGAYAMLAGAVALEPVAFVHFSLLVLLAQVTTGCVGAFLFQAALVHRRQSEFAYVRARHVVWAAVFEAAVFGIAMWSIGSFAVVDVLALALASTAPVFSEWMRYRSMSMDRRQDLLLADGLRLLATLFAPIVLWQTTSVAQYFVAVLAAWFMPFLVLVVRLPRVQQFTPRREYLRKSVNILTDFAVGQLMAAVPLLALGVLGPSSWIGGVRLAQTILGPLNVAFMAFALNLAADSVTRDSHSGSAALIAHGRRLAKRLGVIAAGLIPTAVAAVWIFGIGFRGVNTTSLTIGLLLVGLLAALSGVSSIDAVVLHLLGRNGLVAAGRVTLVTLAALGFVIGYKIGGVDDSLVVGFITAALANPIVFVLPANVVYRKLRMFPSERHIETHQAKDHIETHQAKDGV